MVVETPSAPAEPALRLCSLVSEAGGEDPAGSAWSTPRYLLVELALPWGYDLLAGKRIPAGLRAFVEERYEAGDDWGLIGMAPDEAWSVPGFVRVIDLRLPAAPFRAYARDEYLIPEEDLVAALRIMADDPTALVLDAWRQPDSDVRDLLVCTHGAVDACCAKFGYPVYRSLRQIAEETAGAVRVWRCTHFGGHRFAATLLDMPEGRYWGRLKAEHMPRLVHRDGPAADLRGCYRGWAALPHPVQQVAEAEALVRGGWAWTECLVDPGAAPDLDAAEASISFAYTHPRSGERGEIAIDVLPDGEKPSKHSTVDEELVQIPQFRVEVRRVSPEGGFLGGAR